MRRRRSLFVICFAAVLSGGAIAADRAAATQSLVLDPQRSNIEVFVHTAWTSFWSRLQKFHGDIAIVPEERRIEHAELDLQLSDLKTGVSKRDRDMLVWEENSRFPNVRFRLDALEPAEHGLVARGSLSIHGIEHAVSFPISILAEGSLYAIDGELWLDYRDFGLPPLRKMYFLTVDPQLQVRFHVQGRLASAEL
ncbi:MAG TPA: YceI family protein [Candidatus Didemnitutus sp.]|nr:YceI family protein [Candidatus Didemnitutus sp.]